MCYRSYSAADFIGIMRDSSLLGLARSLRTDYKGNDGLIGTAS
jgi:hypothetical protein